jgi:hypothetical protein
MCNLALSSNIRHNAKTELAHKLVVSVWGHRKWLFVFVKR